MARSIKFTDNTYLNSNDIKINGVGNYALPQSLDNLYQNAKSEPFLTKRGWYRIAQIFDWSNDNWQYKPQSIIINLGTDYSYYNGSNYLVSICKSGDKINATLLNDSANYDCITELRITKKDNKIYLEIYWNAANDDTWGNHFIYSLFSFMGGINVLDVVNGQIVNDDPEVLYNFNDLKGGNWTDIALINTYNYYDATIYNKLQYKKVSNEVFIRGMLTNSVANPQGYYATCGVLPEECRPKKITYLIADETGEVCDCVVQPDGEIRIYNKKANNWISLDSIRFFID